MFKLMERVVNFVGSLICVAPVSLPITVIQLLLLRFCKNFYVQLIPAALGGILFLLSSWVTATQRGFYALMALLLMVPALLLLSGSGMGWLIWHLSQGHLR